MKNNKYLLLVLSIVILFCATGCTKALPINDYVEYDVVKQVLILKQAIDTKNDGYYALQLNLDRYPGGYYDQDGVPKAYNVIVWEDDWKKSKFQKGQTSEQVDLVPGAYSAGGYGFTNKAHTDGDEIKFKDYLLVKNYDDGICKKGGTNYGWCLASGCNYHSQDGCKAYSLTVNV